MVIKLRYIKAIHDNFSREKMVQYKRDTIPYHEY